MGATACLHPVGAARKGCNVKPKGEDNLQFSQGLVEGHPGAGALGRCGSW